ncbi:hypothetical protein BDN67DRAFT_972659 [Paxillus ammoniavirescens]|nr:hypothetical protein BDN67DRAFT_972659 [Paxillus ammoniavirescens]
MAEADEGGRFSSRLYAASLMSAPKGQGDISMDASHYLYAANPVSWEEVLSLLQVSVAWLGLSRRSSSIAGGVMPLCRWSEKAGNAHMHGSRRWCIRYHTPVRSTYLSVTDLSIVGLCCRAFESKSEGIMFPLSVATMKETIVQAHAGLQYPDIRGRFSTDSESVATFS